MFVVVTLLCGWLGWESSVVRQRQALRRVLESNPTVQIVTASAFSERYPGGSPGQPIAKVPPVRRLLGDEAIQEIWYHSFMQGPKVDLLRVAEVFPEAMLREPMPEPCHPGCFPRGTPVATPQGLRSIDTIAAGDLVTTLLPSGEALTTPVQSVFVTENWLWKIETEAGILWTTKTQPLCVARDETRAAGELAPGDTILRFQDGGTHDVRVLAVTPTTTKTKVFNLILGDCEVFVADGYLARSKPPAELAAQ
jgi:hypothetical protein